MPMKIIITILCLILFSTSCGAAVIFEDNFDSDADWTVQQPTDAGNNCSSNCGLPGGWTAYYNGYSFCAGVTGVPGNNSMYIDTYAGYPDETNACFSGAKCVTHWQESCTDQFEDSDGNIGVDLGQEYADIYLRYKIRFKTNFEIWNTNAMQFKLYHVQHMVTGENPFVYLNNPGSENNVPNVSGGLYLYDSGLYFYTNARCQETYMCFGDILWSLGTLTENRQAGGLLDGSWHTVEMRYARNSAIGTADGIIELWVDGNKKNYVAGYEGDDIPFNDAGSAELRGFRFAAIGGNSKNPWDLVGNTMADREQWYSIDDVVVSDTYVGVDYTIGDEPPPDETPPTTAIDQSDPQAISTDSLTVTGTASDAVGVTSCKYRIGAAPNASNGTACTGTTSWSCVTSGYSIGANDVYVGCADAAGNWDTEAPHITVNFTLPESSVAFSNLGAGAITVTPRTSGGAIAVTPH
jgi:hypothetical protein